ncbi:MAG: efflux RND transporter periplasmic adaptor subunit [Candidatus Pacebacteria bacterium]|nr:efflux RND transporter periplasmic adaptor subunit [Candidatus Paceibacterota bacterium]
MLTKVKNFVLSHKILSIIILIILISSPFIIYNFLPKGKNVSYVTQVARKGNISVSVSGTGQVYSLKNIDLSAETSGDVVGVYVKEGEQVNKGDVLFQINSTQGKQDVKSAEIALENAKLDLEKMQEPVDELTLLQAENSLTDVEESKTKAESNLVKAYDDGFTDVSNAFLDLPSIVTGLNSVLFSVTANSNQQNIDYYTTAIGYYENDANKYRSDLYDKYAAAKNKYDAVLVKYKATSRYSDTKTIESLISETYDTSKSIAEALKSATDFIEYYKYVMSEKQQTYSSVATSNISSLNGYSSKINSHISSLLSAENNIEDSKDSIISAERSIKVKQLSLEDAKEGATDLEIRTQELTIEQKDQTLAEAKETLAKYTITAPFGGIISGVDVDTNDTVKSGTIMGSIITNGMIATVTLNEVDITKVKVGKKVELAFDALDGVVVEGKVAAVDASGTVSQGVVSYSVDIAFDTDNESIKPGMSITANIIIESASDVLSVPSSAVKTMGGKSSVQLMDSNGKIERKEVETGITDDATIEIKSGINEGDNIVTQTTSGIVKKTTTTTTTKNTGPTGGSEMNSIMRITR